MKYKYATPSTKVPRWLEADWKRNAPAEPELQSGSIERRALALSHMHKEKQIKPKILFQALALDLLWACPLPERRLPRPVERVIVEALGLPPWHEAGSWHADELETRGGGLDRKALQMARLIEGLYQREYNKPMTLHALEKEMKVSGFKTSRSVLRKWRQKKLRMPINTEIDFEYLNEWSEETLARWRAANHNARRGHVAVANSDRSGVAFGKAVIHPRSDRLFKAGARRFPSAANGFALYHWRAFLTLLSKP